MRVELFFVTWLFAFALSQNCYIVNRNTNSIIEFVTDLKCARRPPLSFCIKWIDTKSTDLYISSSHNNPNATIACDLEEMKFEGIVFKCNEKHKYWFSPKQTDLYAMNCDDLKSGCAESGNNCWLPSEGDGQQLHMTNKITDTSFLLTDVDYYYSVNVHYACDCTLVGCDEFKDITTNKQTGIVFPLGRVNLDTCRFSKRSLWITSEDTSSFMENKSEANDQKTEISLASSLSGGTYQWKIRYEMKNGRSFESPPRALTVLAPPPRILIEGISPIYSTISAETVQYLTEPNALITIKTPSGYPSLFKTGQLDCGSGAFTCDHTKSCTLPLSSSSISCSYLQMISNGEDVSTSSNSAHLIHFVSFGVDFASKTGDQYSVKVNTHTGDFIDGLISEKAVLSPISCTFSSGKYDATIPPERILEFTCPDETSPKIQLVLSFKTQDNSIGTSKEFRSDFIKISSKQTISNLKITATENQIVTASWDFIFPPSSTCSFVVSASVSGSSSQTANTNIAGTSIVLTSMTSSHGTLSISHGDEVSVSVTPRCDGFDGSSVSLTETVCVPIRPVIGDFVCSSCLSLNGFLVSHKLTLKYSFVVSSPGRSCKDSSIPFLYFSFNDAYISVDYLEMIEVSLPFVVSGELSEQTQTPIVSQRLLLNGFVFATNFSYCIVSLPTSVPVIRGETFSYLTFTGDDLNYDIVFFGVRDLYSPCFSNGHYEIEYWTYSDRSHLTYPLKAEATKADTSETLHSITFTISSPEIYYFQIVAVNALNESVKSATYLISVCTDVELIPKPTLSSPGSTDADVSVLCPQFSWELASVIRMIRCDSSETVLLIFEVTETDGLIESEMFAISYSVSLFTTSLILDSSYLLKLSTNYSWRLSVFHQKPSSEPRIVRSDVSTFTTVSKHCSYLDCHQGICDDSVTCVCHSGYRGEFCDQSGLPVGAYVGIVFGILVIVLIFVAVAVVLLKRRYFIGLRIPDMSRFMFFLPKPIHENGDESKSQEEIEEYVENDLLNDFDWITNVLLCTPPTEADSLCRSVMYVFESKKKGLDLLLHLISVEVSQSTSTSTLFRNNSIATKCFRVYGRMYGLPYLFRVVFPLLNKLYKEDQKEMISVKGMNDLNEKTSNKAYELSFVGEETVESYAALIEENSLLLQIACEMFFKELKLNHLHLPPQFRQICQHIASEVKNKYSSHPIELCLAPFLFLRFFVAGITVPETFGIVADTPPPRMRRRLILISKLLSNMSTQVKFGEKEDYMVVMNDYLESKKSEFSEYYRSVLSPSPQQAQTLESVRVPEKYRVAGLEVLSYAAVKVENGEWEEMEIEDEIEDELK